MIYKMWSNVVFKDHSLEVPSQGLSAASNLHLDQTSTSLSKWARLPVRHRAVPTEDFCIIFSTNILGKVVHSKKTNKKNWRTNIELGLKRDLTSTNPKGLWCWKEWKETVFLKQSWCYSSKRGGGESFSWKLSVPGWTENRDPVFSWQWETSERMDN